MQIVNEKGNVQLMQKINRLKVLDVIRQKGEVGRPELAKVTGLSPSSITNIVSYLLEKRLVTETGIIDSRDVGRKVKLLKFNADSYHIISICIEMSFAIIALTNLDGDILNKREIPIDRYLKDSEIINRIKKEVNTLISESSKLSNIEILGIGIAVSGVVEDDKNLIISSSLRWRGLSLKESFEKSFQIPAYVQNNSKTKAISELRNKRSGLEKNIIFLDLSIGIGFINFYDHKINEAVAGELGHTTVKKDGPLCFCGNRGCLELMCSVDTIIEQCSDMLKENKCTILKELMERNGNKLDYDIVLEAFRQGDREVYDILKECGEYLGIGLANIINLFNPQRIIINDDMLLKSEFIFETAIREANKRAYEQFTKGLKYENVCIGVEQSIRGVSLYVADRLFDLSGPEI